MTATAVGTRRSTLWLFALLLAVALWWWWQQHGQARQTAPELPLELREEPDLSASDAVIRQYNDSGAQRYQLHATSIDHYAAEPLTRLRDPKLTLFNASGQTELARHCGFRLHPQPTRPGRAAGRSGVPA